MGTGLPVAQWGQLGTQTQQSGSRVPGCRRGWAHAVVPAGQQSSGPATVLRKKQDTGPCVSTPSPGRHPSSPCPDAPGPSLHVSALPASPARPRLPCGSCSWRCCSATIKTAWTSVSPEAQPVPLGSMEGGWRFPDTWWPRPSHVAAAWSDHGEPNLTRWDPKAKFWGRLRLAFSHR